MAKRMAPSDVRWWNVDTFEAQMRSDLPIGTPKRAVEAYLTEQKLPYSFIERGEPLDPNAFQITIKDIGRRMFFYQAYLVIYVRLNEEEKVASLDFDVRYFGL